MGQLQSKALSRVEEKVNLSRMNIKEFRKGEPSGCTLYAAFSRALVLGSEKLRERWNVANV